MHEQFSVLIVDDEPLARKGIQKLLAPRKEYKVVGECENGIQAVEKIQALQPDIVLLDIQMPGLDGFGVIDAIGVNRMPVTIFVTAYDLHAMKAFNVHAIDYLLKPVTAERMTVALERARAIFHQSRPSDFSANLRNLVEAMKPKEGPLERIVIKSVGKVTIVPVTEIEWIEAEGDYVKLHTAAKDHLLREKISVIETKLDPALFIRIHRSTIVRIQRIRELRPAFNGDHVVILRDGQKFAMSRKFREKVFGKLNVS